jgi:hypothetical protein
MERKERPEKMQVNRRDLMGSNKQALVPNVHPSFFGLSTAAFMDRSYAPQWETAHQCWLPVQQLFSTSCVLSFIRPGT